MTYPLSQPASLPKSAHPGLVWQRYQVSSLDSGDYDKPSLEDLKRLAAFQPGDFYKAAFARLRASLPASEFRLVVEGKVIGRFLTGSGLASVFETAFQFHPVYGVPYLPGSGLRGALRAALRVGYPAEAEQLFGPEPNEPGASSAPLNAGYAVVHDALWVPGSAPAPYAVDVLSVHHKAYYEGKAPPTDFDQPTPIHFLTARGKFLFLIEAPTPDWRRYLHHLLAFTLRERGTGAKKSSGYGRFTLDQAPPELG